MTYRYNSNYHTLDTALEKLASSSTSKQAEMWEAAIHEAGHAVISVMLGGSAFGTEIYWTKAQRQEQGPGTLGSCGIGGEHGEFERLIALTAGPIAASKITKFINESTDYPHPYRECDGATQARAEMVASAEQLARQMVSQHWPIIETVAIILLCGKGVVALYTSDIKELISQRPAPVGASASPVMTLKRIPRPVQDHWAGFVRKQEQKVRKKMLSQPACMPKTKRKRLPPSVVEARDEAMYRTRQRFGQRTDPDTGNPEEIAYIRNW